MERKKERARQNKTLHAANDKSETGDSNSCGSQSRDRFHRGFPQLDTLVCSVLQTNRKWHRDVHLKGNSTWLLFNRNIIIHLPSAEGNVPNRSRREIGSAYLTRGCGVGWQTIILKSCWLFYCKDFTNFHQVHTLLFLMGRTDLFHNSIRILADKTCGSPFSHFNRFVILSWKANSGEVPFCYHSWQGIIS